MCVILFPLFNLFPSLRTNIENVDKVDGADVYKLELIKLEFLMDPSNSSSKYSRQFVAFKDGYLRA
jgi:hypothetical protein